MKKELLGLALILMISTVWPTDTLRFIDVANTTGTNTGRDPDNAWKYIDSINRPIPAPFRCYILGNAGATPSATITTAGTSSWQQNLSYYSLWPRDTLKISGNIVNGSNIISNADRPLILEIFASRNIRNNSHTEKAFVVTAIAALLPCASTTVNFAVGRNVLGKTSGAKGKIQKYVSDSLWVVVLSGTFVDGEWIFSANATTYAKDSVNGAGIAGTVDLDNGLVINEKYPYATTTGAAFTIDRDAGYDEAHALNDAAWTMKIADMDARTDSLFKITFTGTNQLVHATGSTVLQGLYVTGSTNSSGQILDYSACGLLRYIIVKQTATGPGVHLYLGNSSSITNFIGIGATATTAPLYLDNTALQRIENSAVYAGAGYGVNGTGGSKFVNFNSGVDLNNVDYDIQNQSGRIRGLDILCDGKGAGTLRAPSYDSKDNTTEMQNWQRVFGQNLTRIHNGWITQLYVGAATDPVKRAGGSDIIMQITQSEDVKYQVMTEDLYRVIWETHFYDTNTTGFDTVRFYFQNNGFGNINANDTNSAQFYLKIYYPDTYTDSTNYAISWHQGTCNSHPIPNRASTSDWDYLQHVWAPKAKGDVIFQICMKQLFNATAKIYLDQKYEVIHQIP